MLTLRHFILRQRALNLYRSAIRASRSIPQPAARRETIAWIRTDFEYIRTIEGVDAIKDRLSSIRRDLKEVLPSMDRPSHKQ